jgi:pimeloyl-ACP methyl ester carboxylesterase
MALMAVLLVLAGAPSAQARRAVVVEDIEPTVLLIHGGSFTSRAAVANKQAIEDAGWTTLEVTYPFGDVAAAYRAVAAQIPREGPVVAFGESAGGTIALWLAAHGKVDRAVSVGAPTDLTTLRPSQVAHESWRYSPARLEGSRASIYHWTKDPVVDCAQARAVEGAEVHLLDGVNHHGLPEGVAQRAIRRAVRAAARGA